MDEIIEGYYHIPVLQKEVITYLRCEEGGTFVDATIGEGGHTLTILEAAPNTKVIGVDQDETVIERARNRLKGYEGRVTLVHDDFIHLPKIISDLGIKEVDGILFDLGVSTYQLLDKGRGFSFQHDAPLDMRMNKSRELTAYEIVNRYPIEELARILSQHGEERWAKRIALAIERERQIREIKTTKQLAEIVSHAIPQRFHPKRINPATKTFMALRIAVNEELAKLGIVLEEAPKLLKVGGRIAFITFHSLEDRIVKDGLLKRTRACVCPPHLPQCCCGGGHQLLRIINKRPLTPQPDELRKNPRARSARLRVAERVQ